MKSEFSALFHIIHVDVVHWLIDLLTLIDSLHIDCLTLD